MRGTVKWFDDAKGYGFIQQENGGKDCFVHFSEIESSTKNERRTLVEGETVEFEVTQGEKGPKAVQVRRIATTATAAVQHADEHPRRVMDEAADEDRRRSRHGDRSGERRERR